MATANRFDIDVLACGHRPCDVGMDDENMPVSDHLIIIAPYKPKHPKWCPAAEHDNISFFKTDPRRCQVCIPVINLFRDCVQSDKTQLPLPEVFATATPDANRALGGFLNVCQDSLFISASLDRNYVHSGQVRLLSQTWLFQTLRKFFITDRSVKFARPRERLRVFFYTLSLVRLPSFSAYRPDSFQRFLKEAFGKDSEWWSLDSTKADFQLEVDRDEIRWAEVHGPNVQGTTASQANVHEAWLNECLRRMEKPGESGGLRKWDDFPEGLSQYTDRQKLSVMQEKILEIKSSISGGRWAIPQATDRPLNSGHSHRPTASGSATVRRPPPAPTPAHTVTSRQQSTPAASFPTGFAPPTAPSAPRDLRAQGTDSTRTRKAGPQPRAAAPPAAPPAASTTPQRGALGRGGAAHGASYGTASSAPSTRFAASSGSSRRHPPSASSSSSSFQIAQSTPAPGGTSGHGSSISAVPARRSGPIAGGSGGFEAPAVSPSQARAYNPETGRHGLVPAAVSARAVATVGPSEADPRGAASGGARGPGSDGGSEDGGIDDGVGVLKFLDL